MAYRILFVKEAKKDIDRLDTIVRRRLAKKLAQIASSNDILTLAKQLTDHDVGKYRLRIGDYRAIFDLEGKTVYILRVRHRKEVYK